MLFDDIYEITDLFLIYKVGDAWIYVCWVIVDKKKKKNSERHGRNPQSVVANVLDCDIVLNRFKIQLSYYVHLRVDKKYELPYRHCNELLLQCWSSTEMALALDNPRGSICD